MAGAGMRAKVGVTMADGHVFASNAMLHAAKRAHERIAGVGSSLADASPEALKSARAAALRRAPAEVKRHVAETIRNGLPPKVQPARVPPPTPERSKAMGSAAHARFAKVREDTARKAAEARDAAHRKAEAEAKDAARGTYQKQPVDRPVTREALESFRSKAEQLAKTRDDKIRLTASEGDKWIRLVQHTHEGDRGSAWGFINKQTGDIHKADGWNRPAPQVRGNIHGENPLAGVTAYGPAYLNRSAPSTIEAVKAAPKVAASGGRRAIDGPGKVNVKTSSGEREIPTVAKAGENFAYKIGKDYKIANTAGATRGNLTFGTGKEAATFLAGAAGGKTLARALSKENTPANARAVKAVTRYRGILEKQAKAAEAAKVAKRAGGNTKLPQVGGPQPVTEKNIYSGGTRTRMSEASVKTAKGVEMHLMKNHTSDSWPYTVQRGDGQPVANFTQKARALEFMHGAASGRTVERFKGQYQDGRATKAVERYKRILENRAKVKAAGKSASANPKAASLLQDMASHGATVRGGKVTFKSVQNLTLRQRFEREAREAGLTLKQVPSGRYTTSYEVT